MRKVLFLLLLSFAALGCITDVTEAKPIEKYKGCVVIDIYTPRLHVTDIVLKTNDSIFRTFLAKYDAKDLKIGDTIK